MFSAISQMIQATYVIARKRLPRNFRISVETCMKINYSVWAVIEWRADFCSSGVKQAAVLFKPP